MKAFLKVILLKPIFNILILLVFLTPGNYLWVAIVILTLLIKLVLLPSSINMIRSQKRMKDLQPEVQKIKDQYKDDKAGEQKATMDLYRREKINPLASCLPLLIQLPILGILYYAFRVGIDTSRFDLLYSFTPKPELINPHFLWINLADKDRYFLPILAGILQYIQARQMNALNPAPAKKEKGADFGRAMSSQMLYIMPLFTVLIASSLPAALALYWAFSTLLGIVQQWYIIKYKAHATGLDLKANQTKVDGVTVTVREKK